MIATSLICFAVTAFNAADGFWTARMTPNDRRAYFDEVPAYLYRRLDYQLRWINVGLAAIFLALLLVALA